jgi:hypothetical protein
MVGDVTMSGDKVKLGIGTTVFNVDANVIQLGRGASIGGVQTFPTLPLVSPFCVLPPFECGGENVDVDRDQAFGPLMPGSYGDIRIANGGILTLFPGEYHFCSLKAGRASQIVLLGPGQSTIDVKGNVTIGGNAEIIADASGAPPELNLAGTSVRFGPMSTVNAFITAPNALLRLGRSATVHGSFCVDVIGSDNRALLACP